MQKFRQLRYEEWIIDDYRFFADICVKISDLENKFEIKFEDFEEEGIGTVRLAFLLTEKKRQVFLQGNYDEKLNLIQIGCLNFPQTIAEDIDDVLEMFDLSSKEILCLYKDIKLIPHELWRQDDNGHKFLIETFICKADAVKAVNLFENRHHKQTYWIEKAKQFIAPDAEN